MADSVEYPAVDEQAPAADVELESRVVELDRVAPHPGNPRKDLGDLAELAGSITKQGVLQPPVLLPADRVAAAWPAHAGALAGVDWVVLMGHRRRGAAALAGRGQMPALIRRDAIADSRLEQLDAMVAENTARAPLTPVEEARAFAEQEAAGRKQSEIAARAGCSQSHVSKRLKLLKLPTSMLKELETGRGPDGDDETPTAGRARPKLEIGDALAFAAAAGDEPDAQFVMLAGYKLREQNRSSWTPAQLVQEVRREQARRTQREALAKKAEAEGVTVIDDARQRLGPGYWEHRLDGKKAIAKARKDGTLVAAITDGGLAYYTTAGKPKKADNRSEAEQQRLVDERERRKAMTARAEAAAVMANWPPKLPEAAADIVDAWLWAPGNDVAQLARKWLIDAAAGPDPQLPGYQWWEQIRTGDWSTRVRAAHALALARHEVNARAAHRSGWNAKDAAWLARLAGKTGYTPTEWEQARLDAIAKEPDSDADGVPQSACLVFDADADECWVLVFDKRVDEPAAWAEDLDDPDALDDAKAWAEQLLLDEYGLDVTDWQPGQLLVGRQAHLAVFAGAENATPPGHILQHDDVLRCGHCGAVSDSIHADGDPLKAVVRFTDHHHDCPAPAGPGEYRLLYSGIDGVWMVLRDDAHLADHDGLAEDDLDGACSWASGVVVDDSDRPVTAWQARAGVGADEMEHVAELGEPAAASAEPAPPRLVWSELDGWAVHAAGDAAPLVTTGPDIQAEDPVTAQTWAAEQLALDGVEVLRWTACPDGQPGYAAVVTA